MEFMNSRDIAKITIRSRRSAICSRIENAAGHGETEAYIKPHLITEEIRQQLRNLGYRVTPVDEGYRTVSMEATVAYYEVSWKEKVTENL